VSIDITFSNTSHPKSILTELKFAKGLPFSEMLSSESIAKSIANIEYRERIFSPDVVLWMFLSQVLDNDQSLQAAVTRGIAFFLSHDKEAPSPNTAAYSKARTRLPEELLFENEIVVKYPLRAHSPVLRSAGLDKWIESISWLGNRKLKFQWG